MTEDKFGIKSISWDEKLNLELGLMKNLNEERQENKELAEKDDFFQKNQGREDGWKIKG